MKNFLIFLMLFINSFAYATDSASYIDKAISAVEKNDLNEAYKNFQTAFEMDDNIRNSPELNYYYAKLCMLKEDYNKALEMMLNAVELSSNNPVYYLELGKIYMYKNDYLKAINAFQYALSEDKKLNGEIYNYLGIANYRRGDIKTALDNFENADKIDNNNIIILTNLLYCYKGLNMSEKARETYGRIANFNPLNSKDYIALSRIYFENKNNEEAIKILKEGIKKFPHDEILKELYNKLNKT